MKKSILYSLVIFLSVFLGGCEKDEPMGYRGRPGVYFNGKEFSYTFAENPWKDVDTVLLPILLTGDLEDYDRKVKVVVVADSTTATGDMYELLEGTISAGSESGFVPVVVNRYPAFEQCCRELTFRLVGNHIEIGSQHLDIVSECFHDERLFFVVADIEPGLSDKFDPTLFATENRRVDKPASGIQIDLRTVVE